VKTFGDWKRVIRSIGYPETPRAERRSPSGIAAEYVSRSGPKVGRVRNISTTGLYVETEDRWQAGEVIQLTLLRETPAASVSQLQIKVQVRIVVQDENGVGAAFLLPEGLDPELWEALVDHVDAESETEHVAFIFRLVRTILFLCRLCPNDSQAVIQSLAKGLDSSRTESAIQIALGAEELLAGEANGEMKRAHPQIVAELLKNGSWANDELSRRLWTGLLASSCTADGKDESNRRFIELLVEVTANQARIFLAGCREAKKATANTSSRVIIVTPEEIIAITGVSDLYRNATDASYLFNFGLFENVFDFTSYLPKNGIDITPSRLGLELFDLCQGHRLLSSNSLP
jgi:hypothetical protein